MCVKIHTNVTFWLQSYSDTETLRLYCCRQICCVYHVVQSINKENKFWCPKPTLHNKIFWHPYRDLEIPRDSKWNARIVEILSKMFRTHLQGFQIFCLIRSCGQKYSQINQRKYFLNAEKTFWNHWILSKWDFSDF